MKPRRRGSTSTHISSCCCIALLLLAEHAQGQLSKPVAHDSHWQEQGNKFLSRRAENDKDGEDQQFDDIVGDNVCPLDVELKWMTETSSSVYATPLITDLYADGRKDIIVPGFVHYTEVLEGPDGAKALGWPGFHKSTVHSSPLLYDIDSDGIRDILVATYDGEILFFKDNGELLTHRLQVPRLRVRKDWYVGLNPDPVDHSHPDVGAGQGPADHPSEKIVHGKQSVTATASKAASAKATAAGGGTAQPPPAKQPHPQQQQQQTQPQGHVQPPQQAQQQQQPAQQQQPQAPPQQQQQAQQQNAPAAAAASPPVQLSKETQEAVLKFRNYLKEYAAQFGQAAADAQLEDLKSTNRPMYDAIQAAVAKEKEMQQLLGNLATGTQQQQQQQQAAAHQRRRLMSVEDSSSDEQQQQQQHASRSSSSSTGGVAGESLSSSQRRLMQDAAAADGTTPGTAAAVGSQDAAAAAGGVEPDPTQKPLTEEALNSFNIFEDDADTADDTAAAGGAAGSGADQPEQQYGQIQEPEDLQETAAAAVGADQGEHGARAAETDGYAAAAADDDEYRTIQEAYQYPYHSEYDEFGDKLAAAAEWEDARNEAAAAGGQLEQQQQQLRDFGYDSMWEDETFQQAHHTYEQEFVYLDAHILCTPAIADIDADQHDELVVAVSYFYDKEYYDDPAHQHELKGIDKEKYVAGGVVVFDLRTRLVKWQQHLDLTTATTKFTAHMFSSPTLADVDADGHMEIVVGTSVGFVYVLDHKGSSRPGWPIQMGEVQGQVLVADLNHDGAVEILAGDTLGNVALLDINGKEIWERHVKSMITQGAVAGDVDADGMLEVVFGTADGKLHVLRGVDGNPAPGFPFQTGGRIQAPATITQLRKGTNVQHIMVMSFDGYLYLVDGESACAHSVDIGEASYASVLVDDLCGDGRLELLVSTMNGNVYMLQTQQAYHPAKTWVSQVQGINGLVARWGYFGFVATAEGRQLRDVAGQALQVQVELWDHRAVLKHGVPMDRPPRGPYNVTVMLKGVGVTEMNAGATPVIGISDVFVEPGKTVIELPCPRTRTTAAVHLDVITKHGLHFEDEFVVSFHMHFHKLLKWLIALPVLVMSLIAVIIGQSMGFDDSGKSYHLG